MLLASNNFDYEKPYQIDGDFKWFLDEYFKNFISEKNAFNLPPLKDLAVFVVQNKKEDLMDYVLIDNKQQVISAYPYGSQGFEQMEAKIKIIKISKYFDNETK